MRIQLFEDFIDDLEQQGVVGSDEVTVDTNTIENQLHLPTGKEKFVFKYKQECGAIQHCWMGDEQWFYPVRTVYNRIWKAIDMSNFFINPSLSLPFVSDKGNEKKFKAGEFRVTKEQFDDEVIDINKLYGFNELSQQTDFTYDICFDGIVNCSFSGFITKLDRILAVLDRVTHYFTEDRGEMDLYDMRSEKPKKINNAPIYTFLSTLPQEAYFRMYSVFRPEKATDMKHDDHWGGAVLRRQRSNLNFEAIVRNGLVRASQSDLHPECKLIDTVDKPYFDYFADNGKNALSFAMIDMKFPEQTIDIAQIDFMIATTMIPMFPKGYFSAVTPVFIIRTPNTLVTDDRKKAQKDSYGRYKSEGDGEYAKYKEHKNIWYERDATHDKIEVEEGGFYSSGHKYDWRTRKGKQESKQWIVLLADKNGNIGRTSYANKNFQYPFKDSETKQLRLFIDRSMDIWDFSYNLSTSEWY